MDTVDPARFILASFVVLGMIGLLAVVLKRYGQKPFAARLLSIAPDAGRVKVVEVQYIDHKSKIVLVRRDHVEHLMLINEGVATIIESGIEASAGLVRKDDE